MNVLVSNSVEPENAFDLSVAYWNSAPNHSPPGSLHASLLRMSGRGKKKTRGALNRFADTGRLVLVSGATLLPMRTRSNPARVSAGACLLSIELLSKVLKKEIAEERPNGEDDKSFPSEHSAECVAAAMLLEREYGGVVGALGFGLASSVCMARIQSKKHHPRDVAAGALIAGAAVWLSLKLRLAIERRMLATGYRR